MREKMSRYSTVSIILHWTIFVLIFANATFGGWMEEASSADKLQYYELHRSVGITVLLLSLVRLGWRFAHPWPAFPEAMPTWERILARTTHVTFYVLMIGAPLRRAGRRRATCSVSSRGPTCLWRTRACPKRWVPHTHCR